MVRAALSFLLFLSGALCASSKRLIAFGDSITDNGNGTNFVVQAFYSKMLGQPVTAQYPPGPLYNNAHFSNGPVWAEYLADLVGYDLVDHATGSALTNRTLSYHDVGDFYPSNLISNKRGAQNVTLPTLTGQIKILLGETTLTKEDVFVVEIGNNDLLRFFLGNILETLTFVEMATANETLFPLYVVDGVAANIREGLETLHAAGGRKFVVFDIVAGELLPLSNTLNGLLNQVNNALDAVNKALNRTIAPGLNPKPNAIRSWTRKFVDIANAAIEQAVADFAGAHPGAQVVGFPLAAVQRGLVAGYDDLGFVNAEDGCASLFTMTQYSTGNLFSRADPTFTADAAKVGYTLTQATVQLTPLLWNQLKKLGDDLYGVNGLANVPTSDAEFLTRLKNILISYVDSTNTLGHLTGEILTSLPLGKGGVSPYDVVPTCILQAGDHLFHDEVHPTTRQHQLLADAVLKVSRQLFK